MTKNNIMRAYSIKEVSKKLNIPNGTIRQWEKDLQGLIHIPRSKQGARFYTDHEISLLQKIKEMREKKISKEMIRSLLEKHIRSVTEEPKTSAPTVKETNVPAVQEDKQETSIQQSVQGLPELMDTYKENLVNEIRLALHNERTKMVDELKEAITEGNIQTIQGMSKSIARSNDRRKADVMHLSDLISKNSELTAESFTQLSDTLVKDSKEAAEKFENLGKNLEKSSKTQTDILSKQAKEFSKTRANDSKALLSHLSKALKDSTKDTKMVSQRQQEEQLRHLEAIQMNLDKIALEIQQSEESFQTMISSYEEAAASKKNKKWWKPWS
ncbi:MerR family transcriptional regulator [Bacillus massiliglaciei]|uniref:MerR family transcriptional regulator n=1 Tax=Bacillus massiliglaciei TaxID=1816693 RepID=UPI0018FEB274|nr:MerR family transcriptional regulator [Bacillus massiliglaciei]